MILLRESLDLPPSKEEKKLVIGIEWWRNMVGSDVDAVRKGDGNCKGIVARGRGVLISTPSGVDGDASSASMSCLGIQKCGTV